MEVFEKQQHLKKHEKCSDVDTLGVIFVESQQDVDEEGSDETILAMHHFVSPMKSSDMPGCTQGRVAF